MAQQKRQTGIRLSETDEKLLAALSTKKGVNKTSIIVLAIREMAERERIALPQEDTKEHENK